MKRRLTVVIFLAAVAVLGYIAFTQVRGPHEISLSELIDRASAKEVRTAFWSGDTVTGQMKDGTTYRARVAGIESPLGYSTFSHLELNGVQVKNEGESFGKKLLPIVIMLLVPLVFVASLYYLFIKPAQTGSSTSSGVSPPRGTPEERLAKIDDLHARGLLSDEERARLRESVLKNF